MVYNSDTAPYPSQVSLDMDKYNYDSLSMSGNCAVDNDNLTMLHMIVDKDGRCSLTI